MITLSEKSSCSTSAAARAAARAALLLLYVVREKSSSRSSSVSPNRMPTNRQNVAIASGKLWVGCDGLNETRSSSVPITLIMPGTIGDWLTNGVAPAWPLPATPRRPPTALGTAAVPGFFRFWIMAADAPIRAATVTASKYPMIWSNSQYPPRNAGSPRTCVYRVVRNWKMKSRASTRAHVAAVPGCWVAIQYATWAPLASISTPSTTWFPRDRISSSCVPRPGVWTRWASITCSFGLPATSSVSSRPQSPSRILARYSRWISRENVNCPRTSHDRVYQ